MKGLASVVVFTATTCAMTGAGLGWFLLALGFLSIGWLAIFACIGAGGASRVEEERWAAEAARKRSRDAT